MFDEFLSREDVKSLLENICNSARYHDKNFNNSMGYQIYSGSEQVLFLFYDVLFKYKIIIEDMSYFEDFIEQVDKLIRRIDNFYDISSGMNRIIGRFCALKLGIKDSEEFNSKNKVLKYMYDKYIVNGYIMHGYASCYYKDVLEHGFIINNYVNYYDKFLNVQKILNSKNHGEFLTKDFNENKIEFTDNFLLGCYYSVNAPMFFSKLLCKNGFVNNFKDVGCYSKKDYNGCLRNLNKLINGLNLNDNEKNIFMDAFKSQWNIIDKKNSNISLILIPRNLFIDSLFDIDKFIQKNKDLSFSELVCKFFSKTTNVVVSDDIMKRHITFVNLHNYENYVKEEKKESLKQEIERTLVNNDDEFALSNTYGNVSVLLIIGTLLISLGVILTILMFS